MGDCPIPAERLQALGFALTPTEGGDQWVRPASSDAPPITVRRATAQMQEDAVRQLGETERPNWLTCWPAPPDGVRLCVPFADEEDFYRNCRMAGVEWPA